MSDTATGEKMEELRSSALRIGMAIAAFFWAIHFAEVTALSFIDHRGDPWAYMAPRIIVFLIGMVVTACMIELLNHNMQLPVRRKFALTAAAVLLGSLAHALSNFVVFRLMVPGLIGPFKPLEYLNQVFNWIWFFASIAAATHALAYAFQVRERERRMRDLRSLAQEAQMRALRYQLNPHFLFNTLNSIAALTSRSRNRTAEKMVENLSDFLRSSLQLDPHDDIMLSREIELQSLYLEIETLRFPDRLRVAFNVPDSLGRALVPSLITQPLVENAVKYAVASSEAPVTIEIVASELDGQLRIEVVDTGCENSSKVGSGTGIGLANVAERLRTRFGAAQAFAAGPNALGGFMATIELPLRYAP